MRLSVSHLDNSHTLNWSSWSSYLGISPCYRCSIDTQRSLWFCFRAVITAFITCLGCRCSSSGLHPPNYWLNIPSYEGFFVDISIFYLLSSGRCPCSTHFPHCPSFSPCSDSPTNCSSYVYYYYLFKIWRSGWVGTAGGAMPWWPIEHVPADT